MRNTEVYKNTQEMYNRVKDAKEMDIDELIKTLQDYKERGFSRVVIPQGGLESPSVTSYFQFAELSTADFEGLPMDKSRWTLLMAPIPLSILTRAKGWDKDGL